MYPDGITVDPGMVRQAIQTYGVGSIYNHYYFVSSRGTGIKSHSLLSPNADLNAIQFQETARGL